MWSLNLGPHMVANTFNQHCHLCCCVSEQYGLWAETMGFAPLANYISGTDCSGHRMENLSQFCLWKVPSSWFTETPPQPSFSTASRRAQNEKLHSCSIVIKKKNDQQKPQRLVWFPLQIGNWRAPSSQSAKLLLDLATEPFSTPSSCYSQQCGSHLTILSPERWANQNIHQFG